MTFYEKRNHGLGFLKNILLQWILPFLIALVIWWMLSLLGVRLEVWIVFLATIVFMTVVSVFHSLRKR